MTQVELEKTDKEIELILTEINSSLPSEVKIASVANIPFNVLSWRETLFYRNADLSNTAFYLFHNRNYVPATVLIRAQMETTGFIVWSYKKISKCLDNGELGDIDNFLMRGLYGGKEEGRIIDSHNVLTAIDHVGSEFREYYDMLSEFAHPNNFGTHGSFSKLDKKNFRIELGFYINELPWDHILKTFQISLTIFKEYYNKMYDLMIPFKDLCESKLKSE